MTVTIFNGMLSLIKPHPSANRLEFILIVDCAQKNKTKTGQKICMNEKIAIPLHS